MIFEQEILLLAQYYFLYFLRNLNLTAGCFATNIIVQWTVLV